MSRWVSCWRARIIARALRQESPGSSPGGQLEGPTPLRWVGPLRFSARCYRFCYHFSPSPADRYPDDSVEHIAWSSLDEADPAPALLVRPSSSMAGHSCPLVTTLSRSIWKEYIHKRHSQLEKAHAPNLY